MGHIEKLRSTWTELYSRTLPSLARARDPAQLEWPVALDHCFARIILDNTVGESRDRWDTFLKRPALRNMSCEQLEKAIELAERIKSGKEDLVALNLLSLEIRTRLDGKKPETSKISGARDGKKHNLDPSVDVCRDMVPDKRQSVEQGPGDVAVRPSKKAKTPGKQSTLNFAPGPRLVGPLPSHPALADEKVDLLPTVMRIKTHPALTPYRKRLYTALLSVPKGRYTTYAALSDFLNSSARAVGNGIRNNPLAPDVPCHRVLASDGSIGGFGGSWGVDSKNAAEKFAMLKDEGVRFDTKGKAAGTLFEDFVNLLEVG